MNLGELHRPRGSRKTSKRLGQGTGSGTGKTAGKGHKGQRSRSGARRGGRTGFEGGQMPIHRRLPKVGFSNHRFKKVYQVVNVGDLESRDLEGEVGPAELVSAGLVRKSAAPIKVLGNGNLTRGLTVRAHAFSRSAVEKIQSAGGSAQTLGK